MGSIAKAIAGFLTAGIAAGVSAGWLPEHFNSPEFIGGITAVVTGVIVWLIPNKK